MLIVIIIVVVIVLFFKFYEPIFDVIESVLDIFGSIRSGAQQTKYKSEKRKKEKLRDQQMQASYEKYQSFQSEEELPEDMAALKGLYNKFQRNNDDRRAFLCLKKSVDLYDKQQGIIGYYPKYMELAEHYQKGIGTEKNPAMASALQAKDIVFTCSSGFDDKLTLSSLDSYWNGTLASKDPDSMYQAAQELCSMQNPWGLFILEDSLLEKSNGITADSSKEEKKAIYEKLSGNAYALYHLSLLVSDSKQELLEKSADMGCFFAAVKAKRTDAVEAMKKAALEKLSGGFESALEYVTGQTDAAKQGYMQYEQGKAAYEADANNKNAVEMIRKAADNGLEQAKMWLLEYCVNNGDPAAEYELAELYETGNYWVKKDPDKASLYYMRSAVKGYAPAQFRYGQMLENGELGTPKNEEQAEKQYCAAAELGDGRACLLMGKRLSLRPDRGDQINAERYLRKATALNPCIDGNSELIKEAWYTLMQLYRGYRAHNEVYPTLDEAFRCAVEYIRLAEPEKIKYIGGALAGNASDIEALSGQYLRRITVDKVPIEEGEFILAINETVTLQAITAYEKLAQKGDTEAMMSLFDLYGDVGEYRIQTIGTLTTVRFSENNARRRYWLDKAIELGDVNALRMKGEYYYVFGLTEQEGDRYLAMAAKRGDVMAKDTLDTKDYIRNIDEKRNREMREWAESNGYIGQDSKQDELSPAPIAIELIPDVITGPYGNTYRRISISSGSSEYQGDLGDIITIRESDIKVGLSGYHATVDGKYLYW